MTGTFADIIAANFQEIQRNFKSGLKNKGYSYDEDLMNDAFVSCNATLKDRQMKKKDAIKYYWTAYINKFKTKQTSKKPVISYENIIEEIEPIDNQEYREEIDQIYDIIIKAVQDKFGIKKAYIWDLYVCKGKSIKEIRSMGLDCIDNYVYFTRQVKRYILNHVVPFNRELQELLSARKDQI